MASIQSFKTKLDHISFLKIILLGLIIRILLMPLTGHRDTATLFASADKFISDGFLVFYKTHAVLYPPLAYLTLGFWQNLIRFLLPSSYPQWQSLPILYQFISFSSFRIFFLLKLFYLPFDIGTAFIISKFGRNFRESKILFTLWIFNPIVLYTTSMWGSLDIIPTFLSILSIYLIYKKKPVWGFFLLGIAAQFKLWPLLLLPLTAVISQKSLRQQIKMFLIGIIPFISMLLPVLTKPDYLTTFTSSERSTLINNASIYIGFSQYIYIFLLIYLLIIFYTENFYKGKMAMLTAISLIVLAIFYITSAYTPQWFLWILPYLIIQTVYYPQLFKSFVYICISYLLVILTYDAPLSIGLFAPFDPSLLNTPILKELFERTVVDPNKIWSVFRTINAATIIWFIYHWRIASKKS
ncbi:hypothetical protein A2154_02095 [Candidatus Gottesmanbacteria bacterium RBG_16_43_7]|uniref:DUF2029 domain-containing protein n=1 Tax=Candidatus Gottesmanbacteria bacterium RBG_16_43_7 TaxID=1798373 RepID=A0A1F5ZC64_9BACT|nr:MAG: hypothetical protein A2154_02095 [Candidatus Gottesmanbacteria bacterium RBG_16_43_7]